MKVVRKNIEKLKFAPYNPRKISKQEYNKLKKSIESFGLVDPLIWNKTTGHVVGGNQRLKVLKELGFEEVEVVELELDLETEKALNLALNKISGDWNMEMLRDILNNLDETLAELAGFTEYDLKKYLIKFEPLYTTKIPKIQYEPLGVKPQIHELYNAEDYYRLLDEIEKAENITEEEREFLKLAASRWIEYRFDLIAEYYAQSSPELQRLMERLALVVVDFNDAINMGIVNFTKKLRQFLEDLKEKEEGEKNGKG